MGKHKTREGDGELRARTGSWNLNTVDREGLPQKVTYQRRCGLGKGVNYVGIWGRLV